MALMYSTATLKLGDVAPDFSLKATDEKVYSLKDFENSKALILIFMCNHCPYVVAVQDRINQLAKTYHSKGVALIGINSNDPIKYPADNFEAMKVRVKEVGFEFPYVQDLTQSVARAYDAVCTPDPYVFEKVGSKFVLRYHGRIDDNWKEPSRVTRTDLADAVDSILLGKSVLADQSASMGCSIKWA